MSDEWEEERKAAEARIGADRMAAGLSCIPHPVKGDLDWVMKYKVAYELQVKEREKLRKLYDLRGAALLRPCCKCGYVPKTLHPQGEK